MHAVETEMETVHIYVVREEAPRPFVALPLFGAVLCLLSIVYITLYSGTHPTYVHQTLRLPVTLTTVLLHADIPVHPTGIRMYPATNAHGTLTFTNGSIIGQSIPAGFTTGEVATDSAVYVPPGSANGYGYATVSAHALIIGQRGNITALAINQVIGASVYVRNLSAFNGGRDSYTVRYITVHDTQTALLQARSILLNKSMGLHYPCTEKTRSTNNNISITWRCTFVTYRVPALLHVVGIQLRGTYIFVSVVSLLRPVPTHGVK